MATTVAKVKEIYWDSGRDDAAIVPFVDQANLLVSEDLSGSGLTSDRLTMIATYLAAHFLLISAEKGGMISQKMGGAEEMYETSKETRKGYRTTRFGRAAVDLDTSGTLAAAAASAASRAEFRVV